MAYEVIIGLEVHAQLLTRSKIFCGCSAEYGAEPNTHTCPVCLGLPGVLPVLNRKVVDYTIMMALAAHCSIAPVSRLARKNYFYPDLPKGYQISQYELPLAEKGWMEIEAGGKSKKIRIRRIHMEEDAGKSFHETTRTLLDFNRCGVPLIEIVSEPDIRSPEEATAYLKKLRVLLQYLGICDGNMEEGSLRCDANLSLRPERQRELGVRTEVKNMNSFRGVQRALDYEIRRQTALLESGGEVARETRSWDEEKGETSSLRGKEETSDYRYFPDPDLLPVVTDGAWIERIRKGLPELADEKKRRYRSDYGLSAYDADILVSSRDLAAYFEICQRQAGDPKMAANWIINELLRELKKGDRGVEGCPVSPENLGEMILLIKEGAISGKMGKEVFARMYETGEDAGAIAKKLGEQIGDEGEIERVVAEVIGEHPDLAAAYRAGKMKLLGYFVGEVMKKTKGKANPQLVNKLVRKKLST